MITILDVMGDFTDIKTLGVVSCCSKQAKRLIAPLLEKKFRTPARCARLCCRPSL